MGKVALTTWNGILLGAVSASAMMVFSIPAMNATAMTLVSATVPTAVCDQQIYSGSTPSAVVHTGHDVVVGPVRFGDLDPRLVAKLQGSPLLGIKSQMTVGPTRFPRLLVSAKGARGYVSIVYGQVPSTTTTMAELGTDPNSIVVQAPLSCGLTAAGFVQYGGGFALAKKQCVTLTVSVPGGRIVARKTVPFGSTVVCASRS
jgi:hypothetical protein